MAPWCVIKLYGKTLETKTWKREDKKKSHFNNSKINYRNLKTLCNSAMSKSLISAGCLVNVTPK